MKLLPILILPLLACASQPYVPTEAQLTCFAQADSVATEHVNAECGGHLTGCAAADAIDAQLKSSLAACK